MSARALAASRILVTASPRFEAFHALAQVAGAPAPSMARWSEAARRRLGARFERLFDSLGGAPLLWLALADAAGARPLDEPFEDTIAAIEALSPVRFRDRLLIGQLHHRPAVDALVANPARPGEALARVPPAKREWLRHLGLYPPGGDPPGLRGLIGLARDPATAQAAAVEALRLFWTRVFSAEWKRRRGALARVAADAGGQLAADGLSSFARAYGLNIEIDERRKALVALRGGYRLRFTDIEAIRLYPSVFNHGGYWTVFDGAGKGKIVEIAFLAEAPTRTPKRADPALMFRALGDPTRFALVAMIARRRMTSVELAAALAVSKPTIAHHVHLLREAGLLDEHPEGTAIHLSLRRAAVAGLSRLALERLYGERQAAPRRVPRAGARR